MPLKKELEIPKPEEREEKHSKGDLEPVLIPEVENTFRAGWKVWFSDTESEVVDPQNLAPFLAKLGSMILKNL